MTERPARNLIGGLIHSNRGEVPGITVVKQGDNTMAKAKKNGSYELNGHYFKVRKGDPLPDGAVMDGDEPEAEPAEERAQQRAPENKSKSNAPEQK
jgi:hypothetical protein